MYYNMSLARIPAHGQDEKLPVFRVKLDKKTVLPLTLK